MRRIAWAWFPIAVVVGCSSNSSPKPGATCVVNTDCNNPLSCTFGRCHEACRETRDCQLGARCVTGPGNTNVCQFLDEKKCVYASDCPAPLFCAPDSQCRNQCQADRDCLVKGQTCVQGACADPEDIDTASGKLKLPDGGAAAAVPDSGADAAPDTLAADAAVDEAAADAPAIADAPIDLATDVPLDAAADLGPPSGIIVTDGGPAVGRLYYSRVPKMGASDGEVWVIGVDGTGDKMVTTGIRPALSPDGKYLTFERNGISTSEMSRGDVWLRDLQAGTETKIIPNTDFVVCSGFVPDGTHVLYDYSCGLGIVGRDGMNPMPFPTVGGGCFSDCPVESPDGMFVAVHNDMMGIGVEHVDGSKGSFVVPNAGELYHWPRWSSDSAWLSFVDDAKTGAKAGNVHKVHPDGTGQVQLSYGFASATTALTGPATWSADGAWVFAAGSVDGMNAIYAVRTDGSGQVARIAITAGAPVEFVGAYTN